MLAKYSGTHMMCPNYQEAVHVITVLVGFSFSFLLSPNSSLVLCFLAIFLLLCFGISVLTLGHCVFEVYTMKFHFPTTI